MFRIRRVPPSLDKFFQPLHGHFPWDHFTYFRFLVVTIALMWGRRNVANVYRYLEAPSHRTRWNNVFLVARWDPEAALRQKAQELLRALHPQPRPSTCALMMPRRRNGGNAWTRWPRGRTP